MIVLWSCLDLPEEEFLVIYGDDQKYQWQKSQDILSLCPVEYKERHDQNMQRKPMLINNKDLCDVVVIVT